MLTIAQAQELIRIEKKIVINGIVNDSLEFNQNFPFQERYTLMSPSNLDYTFLYEINQSKKNQLKLTLHLMEEDTRIGLIRIDFCGQHENPHTLNSNVPTIFHPFVGSFFDYNDHHIHYYVDGYKSTLDWALPLAKDSFGVKEISNNNDVLNAFINFNQIINLQTIITINPLLL